MMAVLVVTAHKVQICTEVSTIHILFSSSTIVSKSLRHARLALYIKPQRFSTMLDDAAA